MTSASRPKAGGGAPGCAPVGLAAEWATARRPAAPADVQRGPASSTVGPSARGSPRGPREPIVSETLFAGAREIQIVHGGVVYRLKQTALGKLILTK